MELFWIWIPLNAKGFHSCLKKPHTHAEEIISGKRKCWRYPYETFPGIRLNIPGRFGGFREYSRNIPPYLGYSDPLLCLINVMRLMNKNIDPTRKLWQCWECSFQWKIFHISCSYFNKESDSFDTQDSDMGVQRKSQIVYVWTSFHSEYTAHQRYGFFLSLVLTRRKIRLAASVI